MQAHEKTLFRMLLPLIGTGLLLVAPAGAELWQSKGLAGEELESIAVLSGDPVVVFVGGGPNLGGGMWRTLDGGATWTPINNGLGAVHRVNTIAFQPASTTESGSSSLVHGIDVPLIVIGVLKMGGPNLFRSDDAGDTWTEATTGLPSTTDEVTALVFDPQSTSTVFAGLNGPEGGVHKSMDGAITWSSVSTGLADGLCTAGCVLDLAIDPLAPSTIYAAMPVLSSVYKTVNGGVSWSATSTDLTAEELALNPRNPQLVVASGTVPEQGGIEKTADGGAVWEDLSDQPGLPPSAISSHRAMTLNPAHPDRIWLVVEDVFAPIPLEAVYRTDDGGLSWALADDGLEGVRVRQLVHSNGWVWAATSDGVYRAFDGLFADGFESGTTSAW